jgi:hypothetical protein
VLATPKKKDGSATQPVSLETTTPATITVATQALDSDGKPLRDLIRHTYRVTVPT